MTFFVKYLPHEEGALGRGNIFQGDGYMPFIHHAWCLKDLFIYSSISPRISIKLSHYLCKDFLTFIFHKWVPLCMDYQHFNIWKHPQPIKINLTSMNDLSLIEHLSIISFVGLMIYKERSWIKRAIIKRDFKNIGWNVVCRWGRKVWEFTLWQRSSLRRGNYLII
jgi:hypothetical protein